MDKQFARILMLSILLPAGAALAEAIQHEHISYAAMDKNAMSNLAEAVPHDMAREPVSENKPSADKDATHLDRHIRDVARNDMPQAGTSTRP